MQLGLARALHVLLVGPTGLLGPHLARELARDHEVTLVHRCDPRLAGCSGQPLAGELESAGFVEMDHDRLRLRRGSEALEELPQADAVVDNAAFHPHAVERFLARLPAAWRGRYVLMSSMSACDPAGLPLPGDAPMGLEQCRLLGPMDAEALAAGSQRRHAQYGRAKADCERAVEKAGVDAAVLRLNWLAGPGPDAAGLLPWWLWHAASGEPLLLPGAEDQRTGALQLVDVEALARWAAALVRPGQPRGPFLVAGRPHSFAQFLDAVFSAAAEAGFPPGPTCAAPGDWGAGPARGRGLVWPYMLPFQPEGVVDDGPARRAAAEAGVELVPALASLAQRTLAWQLLAMQQTDRGQWVLRHVPGRSLPRAAELRLYDQCRAAEAAKGHLVRRSEE